MRKILTFEKPVGHPESGQRALHALIEAPSPGPLFRGGLRDQLIKQKPGRRRPVLPVSFENRQQGTLEVLNLRHYWLSPPLRPIQREPRSFSSSMSAAARLSAVLMTSVSDKRIGGTMNFRPSGRVRGRLKIPI